MGNWCCEPLSPLRGLGFGGTYPTGWRPWLETFAPLGLVLRHTRNCGLQKTLMEPNRDREGAETQGMTVAGGGRFLTGAVRITRKFSKGVPFFTKGEGWGMDGCSRRLRLLNPSPTLF